MKLLLLSAIAIVSMLTGQTVSDARQAMAGANGFLRRALQAGAK